MSSSRDFKRRMDQIIEAQNEWERSIGYRGKPLMTYARYEAAMTQGRSYVEQTYGGGSKPIQYLSTNPRVPNPITDLRRASYRRRLPETGHAGGHALRPVPRQRRLLR